MLNFNINGHLRKFYNRYSFVVLLFFFMTASAHCEVPKNVVVLHSYHQGLEWTDNITRGIQSLLKPLENKIEVHYEYLDTKRNFILYSRYEQIELLKSKYSSKQVDVIIVSDNNALKFIKDYGKFLFPNSPVVFCGINNFRSELILGMDDVTGVVELNDYKGTIELMLELHPSRNNILVVVDETETGLEIKKKFDEVAYAYNGRVNFEYYQDFLLEEVEEKVSGLGAGDLIYLLTFNRDRNNNFISYSKGIETLSQASPVPIYGSWDFYFGKGILGGIITSGFEQGEQAAHLALNIISGKKAKDFPILRDFPNECMIDYIQMQKYGIKTSQLPENCVVINTPQTFYVKYKKIILLLIQLTVLIIIGLLWNLRNQVKERKRLIRTNVQLDNLVKERTTELIESNEKLNKIINTAPSPIFYKDNKGIYRGCNDVFADKILGLPKEKIIGSSMHDMPDRIPGNIADQFRSRDSILTQKPGTLLYEAVFKCADNINRDFLYNKATLTDAQGKITGIVGVMIDISELKKSEDALIESKERFKRLLEASFGGVAIHENLVIIDANMGLSHITGYSHEELIGMDGLKLIAPEWRDEVMDKILSNDETLYGVEGIKKNGSTYPLEIEAKQIPYEGRMVRVAGLRDVSERRFAQEERERLIMELQKTNEKLQEISIIDSLTGINNRRYIFDNLSRELKKVERNGSYLSIIMVDIDHFKNINDTYGHPFGDKVLTRIGGVLKDSIRGIDLVGRYGGEEFLFILPGTNIDQGYLLSERIRRNIESLQWGKENFSVTISGGIVQYNGESETELLKLTDELLYKAKSLGRNRIERFSK